MLSRTDIDFIKALLYEANSMAKWYRKKGLNISYKSDNSPVTDADIAISEYLIKGLKSISDIQIISEEADTDTTLQNLFWLIDPIDGTGEYVSEGELYTVNIGLISDNIPLYGFIGIPESDRLYYTYTPEILKIEHEGEEIAVEAARGELKAVISKEPWQKEKASDIMNKCGIARYEYIPCSVKFCLIASGEADLYPRYGKTMEWDTAAGGALISASGGVMHNLEGGTLLYGKEDLVNNGFIAYSKRLAKAQNLR